jgi:hypothetical protein
MKRFENRITKLEGMLEPSTLRIGYVEQKDGRFFVWHGIKSNDDIDLHPHIFPSEEKLEGYLSTLHPSIILFESVLFGELGNGRSLLHS